MVSNLSNLPPGVSSYDIEENAGAFDEEEDSSKAQGKNERPTRCFLCNVEMYYAGDSRHLPEVEVVVSDKGTCGAGQLLHEHKVCWDGLIARRAVNAYEPNQRRIEALEGALKAVIKTHCPNSALFCSACTPARALTTGEEKPDA